MTIKEKRDGNKLVVYIEGKIDTTTSPALNEFFQSNLKDVKELELDLEKVDYVSSAGLRSILVAQKMMDLVKGKMVVSHVCKDVLETFALTCFTDILTII